MSTAVSTPPSDPASDDGAQESWARRLPGTVLRALLTQRIVLLLVLLVAVVLTFVVLSQRNYLTAPYDANYMSQVLIGAVPLVMLGLAELLVITSGRGGIFPKNLKVGTVLEVSAESSGMSLYAICKPMVDPSSVKSVFVITDFSGKSDYASSATTSSGGK